MKIPRTALIAAVSAAVLGTAVGVSAASTAAPTDQLPDAPAQSSVSAGTTADGRSYGPVPLPEETGAAETSAATPDLVAVKGDHGVVGYADSRYVFGDAWAPRSPAEAVDMQNAADDAYRRGERVAHVIPVYDMDGTTQIDTFTLYLSPPGEEK